MGKRKQGQNDEGTICLLSCVLGSPGTASWAQKEGAWRIAQVGIKGEGAIMASVLPACTARLC